MKGQEMEDSLKKKKETVEKKYKLKSNQRLIKDM